MRKLYHKDVFLPQNLIKESFYQQKNTTYYYFTKHINQRIQDKDKSHNKVSKKLIYSILNKIRNNPIIPFEIETSEINGKEVVVKYAIRMSINDKEDMSLVIRNNLIITAYINSKTDNHYTLNKSRYVNEI